MGLFDSLKKKKAPEVPPSTQPTLPSGEIIPPRPQGQFPSATGVAGQQTAPAQQMLQPVPQAPAPEPVQPQHKPEVPSFPTLSGRQEQPSTPPSPPVSTPPLAAPTALTPGQQKAAGDEVKQAIHLPVQNPPKAEEPEPSSGTSLFDVPEETLAHESNSMFSTSSGDTLSGLDLEKPESPPKRDVSALDKGLMEPSFGMSVFGDETHDNDDYGEHEDDEETEEKPEPERPPVESIPEGTPYSRGRRMLHGEKPLFVGVSEYVSILDVLKDIRNAAKQLDKDTLAVDAIRKKVANQSTEWHSNLDEVHKRLAFIDRILFEG